MFHSRIVGVLAGWQCLMVGAWAVCHVLGIQVSWVWFAMPLLCLLGIAALFWFVAVVLYSKLGG